MSRDAEGLIEVSKTRDLARKLDVVFVHGLGGSSHSTWTFSEGGKDFFWPRELGVDLPSCGVWTIGYPAGLTKKFGFPGMRIEKRAGNLSQKLTNVGLGDRPIVFICHSMGGLVVKHMLVDSQTHADLDRKHIVSAVSGIVFCATPHRGSAYSSAASTLGKYFGTPQAHVEEMRRDEEPISFLHEKFIEWHRKNPIAIETYAENIGLKQRKWLFRLLTLPLVVTRASADSGVQGATVKDVDEDHLTIVKPRDRNHDVYAGVLRFIKKLLAEEKSLAELDGIKNPAVVCVTTDAHTSAEPVPANLRSVDLSLVQVGIREGDDVPVLMNMLLVSDEPLALVQTIQVWKKKLANDGLTLSILRNAESLTLTQLLGEPAARGRLLEWLAVLPFSAYMYYAPREGIASVSPEILHSRLVVQPLVHRLSKRTQIISAIHANADITSELRLAAEDIQLRFHRKPHYSVTESGSNYRRSALMELTQLISKIAVDYLGPKKSDAGVIAFDYVRTRIRFAENVVTQMRYIRDKNPLP